MDSEEESASEEAEVESEEESDSGVASLATSYVASPSSTLKIITPSPTLMQMTRTTPLLPTASWHAVPR